MKLARFGLRAMVIVMLMLNVSALDAATNWSSVKMQARHAARSSLGILPLAPDARSELDDFVNAGIDRLHSDGKSGRDITNALKGLRMFSRHLRETANQANHTEITLDDVKTTEAKWCFYPFC